MQDLSNYLSALTVQLDQLLLDPNNPRFSELGEDLAPVPVARYAEEKVQSSAQKKMLNPAFDVAELRDTMLQVGYLPMDRLVVKQLPNQPPDTAKSYVVVEGNRRLSALRLIRALHEEGKVTLDESWLRKFAAIDVLLLSDDAPDFSTLVLPGLRHVSGIKEWGPYQKAKAVYKLREDGLPPTEAAQSLGLSTRAANVAYRCFLALEQMKSDEEFGEHAHPRMYSYFEETFKRPNVKAWLDWSDDTKGFRNLANLAEFYSWIVKMPDGADLSEPKLPEAKSIRDLGAIIDDAEAMTVFRSSGGSLVRALARHEAEQRIFWEPQVLAAREALRRMSPTELRELTEPQVEFLRELQHTLAQVFNDRESLATS